MSRPRASRPSVSVIIPSRNEAGSIEPCLDLLLATSYPADKLEILVADGQSDDGTPDIVRGYIARHPDRRLRLLDNPERTTPCGLNLALREATGDVVVRMDAHAYYPVDYLDRLVTALEESGADNVGTVVETIPAADSPLGRAIALGLSHPLGVGNSRFRIGASEPMWVDHVPFGCWRLATLQELGPFDEELTRGQDVELNARILARGGRILLLPDIVVQYSARRTLGQLGRMMYQYGYYKPLVAKKIRRVLTARQLVPPAFVLALAVALTLAGWSLVPLAAIAAPYGLILLGAVLAAAARHGPGAGLGLALVLPVMHLGYGLGYLRGTFDHLLRSRRVARPAAVALTR